jgi:hypothetical protein
MTMRLSRESVMALAAAILLLQATEGCGPSVPALQEPVRIQVTEGEDYVVPPGKVAVITYLWADSISITDVGISVDGSRVISANQAEDAGSTTVLVTVCGGSTIRVWGGLLEEADARCRGYLADEGRVQVRCL